LYGNLLYCVLLDGSVTESLLLGIFMEFGDAYSYYASSQLCGKSCSILCLTEFRCACHTVPEYELT